MCVRFSILELKQSPPYKVSFWFASLIGIHLERDVADSVNINGRYTAVPSYGLTCMDLPDKLTQKALPIRNYSG